jgi:hypothetical protein
MKAAEIRDRDPAERQAVHGAAAAGRRARAGPAQDTASGPRWVRITWKSRSSQTWK